MCLAAFEDSVKSHVEDKVSCSVKRSLVDPDFYLPYSHFNSFKTKVGWKVRTHISVSCCRRRTAQWGRPSLSNIQPAWVLNLFESAESAHGDLGTDLSLLRFSAAAYHSLPSSGALWHHLETLGGSKLNVALYFSLDHHCLSSVFVKPFIYLTIVSARKSSIWVSLSYYYSGF